MYLQGTKSCFVRGRFQVNLSLLSSGLPSWRFFPCSFNTMVLLWGFFEPSSITKDVSVSSVVIDHFLNEQQTL